MIERTQIQVKPIDPDEKGEPVEEWELKRYSSKAAYEAVLARDVADAKRLEEDPSADDVTPAELARMSSGLNYSSADSSPPTAAKPPEPPTAEDKLDKQEPQKPTEVLDRQTIIATSEKGFANFYKLYNELSTQATSEGRALTADDVRDSMIEEIRQGRAVFSVYDFLGLPNDKDPSPDEVKQAYKILVRAHHPDIGDPSGKGDKALKLQIITTAKGLVEANRGKKLTKSALLPLFESLKEAPRK